MPSGGNLEKCAIATENPPPECSSGSGYFGYSSSVGNLCACCTSGSDALTATTSNADFDTYKIVIDNGTEDVD